MIGIPEFPENPGAPLRFPKETLCPVLICPIDLSQPKLLPHSGRAAPFPVCGVPRLSFNVSIDASINSLLKQFIHRVWQHVQQEEEWSDVTAQRVSSFISSQHPDLRPCRGAPAAYNQRILATAAPGMRYGRKRDTRPSPSAHLGQDSNNQIPGYITG